MLVVAPSLDRVGGQSVQAARLLAGLAREQSVRAGLLRTDTALVRPLRRVKYLRTLVRLPLYVGALVARIPRSHVVHVFSGSHSSFAVSTIPAIAVGRLLRRQVVVHYHSGRGPEHVARSRAAVRALRAADAVVVPSSFLAQAFARAGVATTVIPNHVDLDAMPVRDRVPLRPAFLSIRALEPSYDVETVLRAFAVVQRRRPEAALRIVGEGGSRARLERLAQELDLRSVTFSGRVEPESMPTVYDGADILLNASRVDNMPLSVLEALAAGLVVVSTAAGGIGSFVRDGANGVLVPPGDAEALAAGALRVLDDDELAARLVRTAREESLRYAWTSTGPSWVALYGRLVGADDETGQPNESVLTAP